MGHPARKQTDEFAASLRISAYTGGIGARTRLLQEALDQMLSPPVRDEVLSRAGWDDQYDVPVDRTMDLRQWVDTKLFPRLVDRTTLTGADELRRHIRELLAKTEPPPPPRVPEECTSSGIRARPRIVDPPTLIPCAPGASVLLWSQRPETRAGLQALFGPGVQLVSVADTAELRSTLRVLGTRVSVVLMDRRDAERPELTDLRPDDLDGHQVIVWGPEPTTSLHFTHVFERAERTIGCSPEAGLADVAGLCSTILGVVSTAPPRNE
ncbi:MAG: hypothetical protein AB8I08_02245 [Sandaracinaceae bacterium]